MAKRAADELDKELRCNVRHEKNTPKRFKKQAGLEDHELSTVDSILGLVKHTFEEACRSGSCVLVFTLCLLIAAKLNGVGRVLRYMYCHRVRV